MVDVVLLSLLAMLCGCDDADDIAMWADARAPLLERWFCWKHGPPSQDTILRVFARVKPKSFARMVTSWVESLRLVPKTGQIAIDGKALRGSLKGEAGRGTKGMVFLVNAWMGRAGVLLGQLKTREKSNEITAIPDLIASLDISGCTVSIDAAGCHKHIVSEIISGGGAYLIALKDNQPTLRKDVELLFDDAFDSRTRALDEPARTEFTQVSDVDAGHGRVEERKAYLCRDLRYLTTSGDWLGLNGVGLIETQTTNERTGEVSQEQRYYILSNPSLTAEDLLLQTREHWSVESMHWIMDVVFGEDSCRILNRQAAENFSLLRKTALGLLKAAPPPRNYTRMTYRKRRKWCDWDPDYLLNVLIGTPRPDARGESFSRD
ncbi:MAG: ISAs1 family transposase [Deltaproteobacteria bacterium]|nr:ISAs1 family transposase [Deltaproteobacteria bacterium]